MILARLRFLSGLSIPIGSVSSAIRSAAAKDVPVNRYASSSDVEGLWAEFHHSGNWHMISVSHIDVPVHAAPDQLDKIADELFWQQGQNRKKRRIF
jgi:hypothetical protein